MHHGDTAARSGVEPFLASSGDGIGIGELDTKSSVEGAALESFLGNSDQIVVEPSLGDSKEVVVKPPSTESDIVHGISKGFASSMKDSGRINFRRQLSFQIKKK